MSIALVKKFYELYDSSNSNKETKTPKNNRKKRKAENLEDEFSFKKINIHYGDSVKKKEVDNTGENMKVIQKLAAISSVKPGTVKKIFEHEDKLKKKEKKKVEEKKEVQKRVFNDRDFDIFEKEYDQNV